VALALALMAAGCELRILDAAVHEATLVGTNRQFIESRMPGLADLLVATPRDLLEHADVVVATHGGAEFRELASLMDPGVPLIDLAGLLQKPPEKQCYDGIAW